MSIVKKPVVSEKMTDLTEKLNRYAFVVDLKANKVQIKMRLKNYTMSKYIQLKL